MIANELLILISRVTGLNLTEIKSKDRKQSYVLARHIMAYYLRNKYSFSLCQIGKFFNVHHTTVLNSILKINNMIDISDSLTIKIMTELDILISSNNILTKQRQIIITLDNSLNIIEVSNSIQRQYNCTIELK